MLFCTWRGREWRHMDGAYMLFNAFGLFVVMSPKHSFYVPATWKLRILSFQFTSQMLSSCGHWGLSWNCVNANFLFFIFSKGIIGALLGK